MLKFSIFPHNMACSTCECDGTEHTTTEMEQLKRVFFTLASELARERSLPKIRATVEFLEHMAKRSGLTADFSVSSNPTRLLSVDRISLATKEKAVPQPDKGDGPPD